MCGVAGLIVLSGLAALLRSLVNSRVSDLAVKRIEFSSPFSILSAAVHSAAKANGVSELTQSKDCCQGCRRRPFPETRNLEMHLQDNRFVRIYMHITNFNVFHCRLNEVLRVWRRRAGACAVSKVWVPDCIVKDLFVKDLSSDL